MICPYCQTDNRDDREACYYCKKDLSMLRLIVNKAKHHYNQGLEFAERGRTDDAIGELKNALDLDGSMDNAHVVLGTLYAKKEMFAEARECWNRALSLNHNLHKAHEYLHKAEKAEYVFPALKRLKALALSLSGVALLFLIVTVVTAAVSSSRSREMERAQKTINKDLARVGKAISMLQEDPRNRGRVLVDMESLAGSKDATPVARDLAGGLARHIKEEWQRRLALANMAMRANNTYATMQLVDSVEQEGPTPEVVQSIGRISATAQENAVNWVNNSAEYFYAGRLPYERLAFEMQRYSDTMKDTKALASIKALKEKVDKVNSERMLNEAMETITRGTIVKAVDTLAQWETREPKTAAPLRQALEQRLAAENAGAAAEIRNLIELKAFDKAGARMEDLNLLYASIRRPAPQELLSELAGQIQTAKRQAAYNGALAAFQEKQWEKFLELTQNPKELAANELEVAKLNGMRQEASDNSIRAALAFFKARDAAFKEGPLEAADAAEAIRLYPVALRKMELDTAISTATVLFSAATAYVKLEQPEQALELLKQVAGKYSKSAAARSAARLQKRLEDEKAKKDAAAGKSEAPKAEPEAGKAKTATQAEPGKAGAARTTLTGAGTAKPEAGKAMEINAGKAKGTGQSKGKSSSRASSKRKE